MIVQDIQTKIIFLLAAEVEEVGNEQLQLRKDLLMRLQIVVDTFLVKNRDGIHTEVESNAKEGKILQNVRSRLTP